MRGSTKYEKKIEKNSIITSAGFVAKKIFLSTNLSFIYLTIISFILY